MNISHNGYKEVNIFWIVDFENYLLHSNCRDIISLSKLRCANSKLPIYKHIHINDSDVCTLCNLNVCGDEYHYVLICPFFKHSRIRYLKPYFYTRPRLYIFGRKLFQTYRNLPILFLISFNRKNNTIFSKHTLYV